MKHIIDDMIDNGFNLVGDTDVQKKALREALRQDDEAVEKMQIERRWMIEELLALAVSYTEVPEYAKQPVVRTTGLCEWIRRKLFRT